MATIAAIAAITAIAASLLRPTRQLDQQLAQHIFRLGPHSVILYSS